MNGGDFFRLSRPQAPAMPPASSGQKNAPPPTWASPLRLRIADTFVSRLLGIHGGGALAPDEGLLLYPCGAVHTFFLWQPIDVVFLDARGMECRRIDALPPRRAARHRRARMAVELPAGYCRRHPDYLGRIHAALRLRVSPRLSA